MYGEGSAYYVAARTKAADLAPFFEQMLVNAGITPNKMPPQILYHERSGDGERYGFYLNLADCETAVENVYGFDLVSKAEINGKLVLGNRAVAVIKY